MSWSKDVSDKALIASGRHCCVCHVFSGVKLELHHIVERANGGEDTFENCIVLCFDCHADVGHYNSKHPKGKKYSVEELKGHRDSWYKKVAEGGGVLARPEHAKLDLEVYSKLVSLLPSDGSIDFIRENNFAGFSFELKRLYDLDNFIYECRKPEFEFIDPELESYRASIYVNAKKHSNLIGQYTFPTHQSGWNTVPPEWELDNSEKFYAVVDELHDLAGIICENYDQLVRMARRKLAQ